VSTDPQPSAGIFRRPERLLPFACIAAPSILFASDLMTTFEFVPPGGEALCSQGAAGRHHFALGVIAIFAVIAVLVAVRVLGAVGVLVLSHPAVAAFSKRDLTLMETVGAQIAAQIEVAELHERLKRAANTDALTGILRA